MEEEEEGGEKEEEGEEGETEWEGEEGGWGRKDEKEKRKEEEEEEKKNKNKKRKEKEENKRKKEKKKKEKNEEEKNKKEEEEEEKEKKKKKKKKNITIVSTRKPCELLIWKRHGVLKFRGVTWNFQKPITERYDGKIKHATHQMPLKVCVVYTKELSPHTLYARGSVHLGLTTEIVACKQLH